VGPTWKPDSPIIPPPHITDTQPGELALLECTEIIGGLVINAPHLLWEIRSQSLSLHC